MTKNLKYLFFVSIIIIELFNFIYILIKVPNPDKLYLLHFDWVIPDYQLNGKPNPEKTFETPDKFGLTRFDYI